MGQLKSYRNLFIGFCFALALYVVWTSLSAEQTGSVLDTPKAGEVVRLIVHGAIGPALQDYIERGIHFANQKKARLVVLQIDTPGGLDKSMRGIIKSIFASSVPIASYVAPSGARAASAGTFILYASQIAAMSPGTNLGAASPVQIGGGDLPLPEANEEDSKQKAAKKILKSAPKSTLAKKISNDAVAYIRSLAELHGRNADWAEKAVREAGSITAKEALAINVIDLIAINISDLLIQINGKNVIANQFKIKLFTKGAAVFDYHQDWRNKFLATITDPSVAYILLLIGIYGLFFEFANPGFVVPGVVGAISLLIALHAFQLMPINYAGLGLIILGFIFIIAEAFVPSFGALGIGGVIAFVIGSVLLMSEDIPGYTLAWQLILAMGIVSASFCFIIIGMAVRSQQRKVILGEEAMLGKVGVALENFESAGQVKIEGEIWQVKSNCPIKTGQRVKVTKLDGITASVVPINDK